MSDRKPGSIYFSVLSLDVPSSSSLLDTLRRRWQQRRFDTDHARCSQNLFRVEKAHVLERKKCPTWLDFVFGSQNPLSARLGKVLGAAVLKTSDVELDVVGSGWR
jgi:hypothetical protein